MTLTCSFLYYTKGIVEELHRADSSSDDIWLHEADYRCAVSSKLTIWKQRCWELKRLLADVVELEVHRRTKTRQVLLAFLTKRRLILSKSRELLDPAADELESGRKPRDQVEAAIEESIQLLHVSKLHQQSRTPIFNRARYQLINGIGEVSITAMMTHASTAPLYETSMLKNSLVYEVTPVSFKIGREPKWTYGMAVITTFQHLHLFALTKDDKKTSEDDSKGDNKSNVSMPSLDSTDSSRTDTKNKRAQSGNSGDEEANFNNSSHSEMSINNSAHGGLSSSRDSSSLKRNNGMTRSGSVSSLMSKGLRSSFKRGGSASSLTNSPSKISALTSSPRSNGTSRKGGLSESCPWSEFNLAATSPNNNKNAASVVLADASGMAPMPLCAFDAHHEEALTHKPKACVWLSTCAFGISADGGHVELIPNFDDQAVKIYLRFDEEEGDDDESPSSQCKAATWLRNTQKWAFLASQQ